MRQHTFVTSAQLFELGLQCIKFAAASLGFDTGQGSRNGVRRSVRSGGNAVWSHAHANCSRTHSTTRAGLNGLTK